jgi:hypothetical protein
VDRRADDDALTTWPHITPPGLTIIDLGHASVHEQATQQAAQQADVGVLLVCRATVPGLRAVEQELARLTRPPSSVAIVGRRRWPGAVRASVGPRLRQLLADDVVVTVRSDRGLEATGLTSAPLPRSLTAAASPLLRRIGLPREADENREPVARPDTPSWTGTQLLRTQLATQMGQERTR